jgi:hypothetical protein
LKKSFLFILLALIQQVSFSQKYWQQQANFTISVSLNDKEHTLSGFESIEYINNSPDTLSFIWFHLWPNAYKNDRTAFSEQQLKNGSTDFYYSSPEKKGYINRLDFRTSNIALRTEPDVEHIDILKVYLNEPLSPGKSATITTTFNVKLPHNFSRGGHIGQDYQVTQWFPKPAVYDRKGWHPMPYLDQGEFYSEFGNYDVQVTLPGNYMVAATGILQDVQTLNEMKQTGKHFVTEGNKTWHYKQNNIHDFAWFASKDFVVQHDTVQLSTKIVDVFSFHKPSAKGWDQSVAFAKQGLTAYSNWIGEYPYDVSSIVQGSENENSGGMEYPTITLITTQDDKQELDATIVHEVGHNWFYGALASNERTHPWMDEGMNTFYHKKYEGLKYSNKASLASKKSTFKKLPDDEEEFLLRTIQSLRKDQPIETPSADFSSLNYGLIVYVNATLWMQKLETILGEEVFKTAMKEYYDTWKFKHPYPEDFRASIEKTAGKSLAIFDELNTTASTQSITPKKNIKPTLLFNLKNTENYSYISFLPALAYNNYDKLMPGLMVHNYQLPIPRFKFIGGVLYSPAAKKINPIGRIAYTAYQKNFQFEPAVSYLQYAQNDFATSDGGKLIQGIRRIVPSLKLTLFNKDQTTDKRFTALFKTFLLKEDGLKFETIIATPDTFDVVSNVSTDKTLNRLTLSFSENRILFPYSIELTTDQGKDFVRTGLTANYFFNYAKGGMKARLFAGKFFYTNAKTIQQQFATADYHLNMTGPKGNEDYTYSDYFVGRNEFDGWRSQQIMERDGFFKVRTDFLGDKIGKTDDWLVSMNLVTDIPNNINPLSVLPIKIPIKIFADIGTYAEAWKQETSTGRFLYDAGIQVSLFKSLVNVYLPLIYSKVYSNYFKSTITEKRFLRNIAFNIDLQQLKLNKLLPGVGL